MKGISIVNVRVAMLQGTIFPVDSKFSNKICIHDMLAHTNCCHWFLLVETIRFVVNKVNMILVVYCFDYFIVLVHIYLAEIL